MKTYWKLLAAICIAAFAFTPQVRAEEEPDSLAIWVNGLCGMCKNRIEETAAGTRGVLSAGWEKETRLLHLTVDPDKFKTERLHYQVASAGHDTREILAPDPVYDALPMCCKYRDFSNHEEALGSEQASPVREEHSHDAHEGVVTGQVFETDEKGKKNPLLGANVYWMGTGSGTITGSDGTFSIPLDPKAHMLIISYVGFQNDTLHLHQPADVEVLFSKAVMLGEVEVSHRIKPTTVSFKGAYNVRNIHEKELTKAACCNLSESFETNPSVDVSFTDAVTGTRQIEMLGLAGPYVQITRENMPDVRGLSALYGLTYTPGPWIEGIQLNMGAGSVVNGFESITGQINVELRKPENSDRLYLNLFGNRDGRMEANLNTAYAINEKWHGGLLLHGNLRPLEMDRNGDGFMDHPTGHQIVGLKRFKYSGNNGLEGQFGVKLTYLDQLAGQMEFDPEISRQNQPYWGSEMNTRRVEAWSKIGKVFENRPYTSMGFQLSGVVHRQNAYFGLREYDAAQNAIYSNLIYQSILGNPNHQYRTGLSFQLDQYTENLTMGPFERMEWVPGAFLEYTYNYMDLFTAVAGVRADYHNQFGAFITPRLHLRYQPMEKTVLRITGGRGQKTASIFAEQIGIFASSREIYLENTGSDTPYGLEPEVAWSMGFHGAQGIPLGAGDAIFSLDYFYTHFTRQIVADLDRDPGEVHFYNLDGRSFSHSLQLQLDMEPVERYDIRLAYRFNDVRTTFDGELLPRPLTSRHRGFVNMAYETDDAWTFDVTWSWQGPKRIPGTMANPEPYRTGSLSPAFSLINLQVGKTFFQRLEIYTGVENLFDFRQKDPIIASDDPFGPYFDSSLIWGPVFGRKIYAGLRFRIN